MQNSSETYELSDGDISLWAEPDGPIMLRAVSSHGDPVELAEDEAKKLLEALTILLEKTTAQE